MIIIFKIVPSILELFFLFLSKTVKMLFSIVVRYMCKAGTNFAHIYKFGKKKTFILVHSNTNIVTLRFVTFGVENL